MIQPRLPGTLPTPEEASKRHRTAVKAEREAKKIVENLAESLREAKKALKAAQAIRVSAEDDIEAIEQGRRPG